MHAPGVEHTASSARSAAPDPGSARRSSKYPFLKPTRVERFGITFLYHCYDGQAWACFLHELKDELFVLSLYGTRIQESRKGKAWATVPVPWHFNLIQLLRHIDYMLQLFPFLTYA